MVSDSASAPRRAYDLLHDDKLADAEDRGFIEGGDAEGQDATIYPGKNSSGQVLEPSVIHLRLSNRHVY